jgi:hypothetical protein
MAMSTDSKIWNSYVVRSILANNEFDISQINDIEEITSGYFIRSRYPEVVMLIRNGDVNAIRSLVENKAEDGEYLYVLSFRDQKNNNYIVTVYDSDELWQNPKVIEIFSVK